MLVFSLIAGLYLAGTTDFLESKLTDLRFHTFRSDATADLVIIDIDTASLHELDVWPWPRSHHATVLGRVLDAGAGIVAYDVDFSSKSTDEADAALEAQIARGGKRVVLPIFMQFDPKSSFGEEPRLSLTQPLRRFSRHSRLAFVNMRPEPDGLVRRMASREDWNDAKFPTLAGILAEYSGAKPKTTGLYGIDFGIRSETIPRFSFADVFHGQVSPEKFKGKLVIVGASAAELGDRIAVPVYRALPGPLVQALAYESIAQSRDLTRLSTFPILFVAFILAVWAGPFLSQTRWRRGSGALCGVWIGALAIAFAAHDVWAIAVDVVPWLSVVTISFVYGLIRNADIQAINLLTARLAVVRTRTVLRHIIAGSSDGLIVVGARGTIEMYNPAAESIFSRTAAEVVGQPLSVLFPSSGGGENEGQRISNAIENGEGLGSVGPLREITAWRPDGMAFPLEILVNQTELRLDSGRAADNPDEDGAYILTVRDISQRKRLEAQAKQELERRIAERTAELEAAQERLLRSERLATLGQLTATVSHELRNPLGTIRSSIYVIRRAASEALSGSVGKAVERIERNITRCDNIIDELLDFTRIREPLMQPATLDNWISDVIEELDVPNGIEITRDLACAGEVTSFDHDTLRRSVINVYENACHAIEQAREQNPDAERKISIETRVGNGRVEIGISDTGAGIPDDVMPSIFEPLYSTKGFGVGLGLVVVKRIMDQHNGGVEISTEAGKGTRVLLWLPRPVDEIRVSA